MCSTYNFTIVKNTYVRIIFTRIIIQLMSIILRYLNALKDNRSLIMAFAIGDLKNRYRSSILGFFWSILEPLLLLAVIYVVFTAVLKPGIPNFAIYLLLGLIFWNFVGKSTTMSANSISGKGRLLSNVYFPRAIPAISSTITALIMLCFEFAIFAFFFVVYGLVPSTTIIFLPYYVFLIFIICLGLSLPLSVLNVLYKDVQFIWNIVLSAGFFLHPIIYNIGMMDRHMQDKLLLIPTVRLLDMIQGSTLYGKIPSTYDLAYVTIASFVILLVGYGFYRLFESKMVEEL